MELVATERGGVSGAAVLERMRRVAGHDDIDYNPVLAQPGCSYLPVMLVSHGNMD